MIRIIPELRIVKSELPDKANKIPCPSSSEAPVFKTFVPLGSSSAIVAEYELLRETGASFRLVTVTVNDVEATLPLP